MGLVEPVQRLDLAVGREQLLGLLRDREHLVRVRPAHGDGLAAPREPVLGVGADRREHRERAPVVLVPQERRGGELVQAELTSIPSGARPRRSPRSRIATAVVDAERAGDHRRRAGRAAARARAAGRCSSPSPRAGCAARRDRGGMAPDRVVAARGRRLETADHARALVGQAVLELVDELVRGEDPQRRRRELDRQRDAVEAAADRRREGGVRRRRLDLRAADAGPGEEQLDGGVPGEHVGIGLVLRGHRQRLDPDDALARHADRDPARREDRQARASGRGGRRGPARRPARARRCRGRGRSARGPGPRRGSRRSAGRPRRATPMAPAIAGRTSDGSLTPSSGTNATRPSRLGSARRVSSTASRLFPTPPIPTSVMNVRSRPRASRRTVARSASRPISGASGTSGTAPGQHGSTARARLATARRWRRGVIGGCIGPEDTSVGARPRTERPAVSRRVRRVPEHTPGTGTACRGSGCRRGRGATPSAGSAARP